MFKKLISNLIYWRIERLRQDYENLSHDKQIVVQDYFDSNLKDYWEDKVLSEGACHYDDVDGVMEMAWEWYLEH